MECTVILACNPLSCEDKCWCGSPGMQLALQNTASRVVFYGWWFKYYLCLYLNQSGLKPLWEYGNSLPLEHFC